MRLVGIICSGNKRESRLIWFVLFGIEIYRVIGVVCGIWIKLSLCYRIVISLGIGIWLWVVGRVLGFIRSFSIYYYFWMENVGVDNLEDF